MKEGPPVPSDHPCAECDDDGVPVQEVSHARGAQSDRGETFVSTGYFDAFLKYLIKSQDFLHQKGVGRIVPDRHFPKRGFFQDPVDLFCLPCDQLSKQHQTGSF
jgi:hypothetical protein